jgi:two-component system sensor histidine kinase BaeS
MKLATQVSLLLVSAILVAVIAMGGFVALNLERGFVGYINTMQLRHLEALQKAVTMEAERIGSLDSLRDRRLWNRFLRETEDGNGPREITDLRLPPAFDRRPPLERFDPERAPAQEGERRPPPEGERLPPNFDPERRPPGPGPFKGPERGPPDPLGLGRQFILLDRDRRPIHEGPLPPAGTHAPVERPIQVSGTTLGWIRHYPYERPSRAEDLAFLRAQFFDIGLVAVALLILGLVAAPFVARRWSRPLQAIGTATQRIAQGEFSVRVPEDRGDEIGALARNVNAMGESLGRLEEARKRWIAESAHELRTPLAVLRGEIEALQDGVRSFDAKALASLSEEARHLTKLVNDLHLLAVADIDGLPCVMTRIDLSSVARRALQRFTARAGERGLALRSTIPPEPVDIEADDDRLEQLLNNLLENSLRYTDKPGVVEVIVARDAAGARLTVQDSAPGVREADCPKLFEPLYRADLARTRREGGSGLGLAICRAIVKAHGGTITARPSPLGGLAVTSTFRLAR